MNFPIFFKKLISPALFYSGMYKLKWKKLSRKQGFVIVLCYHRVVKDSDDQECLFNIEKGITASEFERQMKFMLNSFQPIHASSAHQYHNSGDMHFAVTFDDGYTDNLEVAAPILKKLGIPCTLFMVSGFVGTEKLFWWEALAQLLRKTTISYLELPLMLGQDKQRLSLKSFADKENAHDKLSNFLYLCSQKEIDDFLALLSGLLNINVQCLTREYPLLSWGDLQTINPSEIELGAHTATHRNLAKSTSAELLEEIAYSINEIELMTAQKIRVFAYPYGTKEHFNEEVVSQLKGTGCETAYTVCRGGISQNSDLFGLPRVFLNNKYPFIWAYNIESALKQSIY